MSGSAGRLEPPAEDAERAEALGGCVLGEDFRPRQSGESTTR